MATKVNRRNFIKATTAGLALAGVPVQAAGSIPRRTLGKTGAEVSTLAFGGGSRFLMYEDEAVALSALNEAIDSGINYLDTANSYGNGRSEERYGKVLKTRRKEVFLATKVTDRTYDGALKAMEASLKRLQTDHLDLIHVHGLADMDDLRTAEQGSLKALFRLRDEKVTRFVGMTCHSQASALKAAIERNDLDCVQMALNPATTRGFATSFEEIALPAAQAKNLGILAMKVMGQDQIVGQGPGRASARDLIRYAMSLPVAVCVIGMPKLEFLRENIQAAREFQPMSREEKQRVRAAVAPAAARFERFMMNHKDFA